MPYSEDGRCLECDSRYSCDCPTPEFIEEQSELGAAVAHALLPRCADCSKPVAADEARCDEHSELHWKALGFERKPECV